MQGTLVYLYRADWVWLERFHGRWPRAMQEGEDIATLEALARKWREVSGAEDQRRRRGA